MSVCIYSLSLGVRCSESKGRPTRPGTQIPPTLEVQTPWFDALAHMVQDGAPLRLLAGGKGERWSQGMPLLSKVWFLHLGIIHIWGRIILCSGSSLVCCRIFSRIPGSYPPDASSIIPQFWRPKMSPDIAKCPLGTKWHPHLPAVDITFAPCSAPQQLRTTALTTKFPTTLLLKSRWWPELQDSAILRVKESWHCLLARYPAKSEFKKKARS